MKNESGLLGIVSGILPKSKDVRTYADLKERSVLPKLKIMRDVASICHAGQFGGRAPFYTSESAHSLFSTTLPPRHAAVSAFRWMLNALNNATCAENRVDWPLDRHAFCDHYLVSQIS